MLTLIKGLKPENEMSFLAKNSQMMAFEVKKKVLHFLLFACFISSLAWDTQSVDNTINYLFSLKAQDSIQEQCNKQILKYINNMEK